jgi:transposase-like protein
VAAKYTFKQFQAQYPDDDACLDAILQRRYGDIEACPNCGLVSKLTRIQGRRAYACSAGCHIYPCAGTIFEHSSTKLSLWFHAMYLMTATRNGVSAKELERQLGVTYKCAHRIGHQLRELMSARDKANNPAPLTGEIETDECYLGGKPRKGNVGSKGRSTGRRGRGTNKTPVVGMLQREGRVVAKVVDKKQLRIADLSQLVRENVDIENATLITDEYNGYSGIKEFMKHKTINHRYQYVDGDIHTNRIEGFWSHLKRGIQSTHVAVSKQHLQKYVNEFAFRYNNRSEPAEMFHRMLKQISNPISS